MLTEARLVCQRKGEPIRRYFSDDYMELYVWLDRGHDLIGFELIYRRPGRTHSLRWKSEGGFEHGSVDEGNLVGGTKVAPIIRGKSAPPDLDIGTQFAARSTDMEPNVARFVQEKLDMYLSAVNTRFAPN